MPHSLLRALPSVDRLLLHPRGQAALTRYARAHVTRCCRALLDRARDDIQAGRVTTPDTLSEDALAERLSSDLERLARPHLVRVINASGTILHTNLGRAILAPAAVEAVVRAASQPVNLEYDLEKGARGRRESAIEELIVSLTGAEAATVVNNNAAAVLVGVNSLSAGREVIASRGELVEIGGAFRIPDIVGRSGALLREVGTTNRTHAADYERAIGAATGLLLKVHTSNYRIVGFSSDVPLEELVGIGRRHDVPVMEDLGSGALVDLSAFGLPKEPLVAERIAAGVDVVTFSGDKLLGGPQAGLIAGRRTWIDTIKANPLHRAVRCDKMTLAALEATLRIYQQSPDLEHDLPTLAAFTRPLDDIAGVATRACALIAAALGPGFHVSVEDAASQVGSGALPIESLPTKAIVIGSDAMSAERIAAHFRCARPAIIGRINDDRFLLDVRTVQDPADLVPHH
ncbi:MAG: L-seryl-tRNA(Sec) selenium transferase [Vicinamibacterales bacterium]